MRVIRCVHGDYKLAVREAVKVLRAGGVIVYPTETTYGLGCDPRYVKAARRIYAMKGREKHKPFMLVAASLRQVRSVARLHPTSYRLQAKYWPGPLTLVLPSASGRGDVAVRISSHPFVLALTKAYGYPIVSTSANRSGESEARSGRAAYCLQPDLVIDAGSLPRRKPSTIARVHENGKVELLRRGSIRLPHS